MPLRGVILLHLGYQNRFELDSETTATHQGIPLKIVYISGGVQKIGFRNYAKSIEFFLKKLSFCSDFVYIGSKKCADSEYGISFSSTATCNSLCCVFRQNYKHYRKNNDQ